MNHGNALRAGSMTGRETIVKLLIHAGSDEDAVAGSNGNALVAASSRGNTATVKQLINAGAHDTSSV